jgi:regulatory protein
LRRRLLRKGLASSLVDGELDRLQQLGYIDDVAFAQSWVATHQVGATPRGSALLHAELRRKGVDSTIARDALVAADDTTAATVAAHKRAPALAASPYPEFCRRMLSHLQRRGFSYDISLHALRDAWQSMQPAGSMPEDDAQSDPELE